MNIAHVKISLCPNRDRTFACIILCHPFGRTVTELEFTAKQILMGIKHNIYSSFTALVHKEFKEIKHPLVVFVFLRLKRRPGKSKPNNIYTVIAQGIQHLINVLVPFVNDMSAHTVVLKAQVNTLKYTLSAVFITNTHTFCSKHKILRYTLLFNPLAC